MLYLIGIGLNDPHDITHRGSDAIHDADTVYLETYTSRLQCSITDLEQHYNTSIHEAHRDLVENQTTILDKATDETVAFLVIGDVFSATTHFALYKEARDNNIQTKIIHNASILTAVGETGLQLYKFGRTASIPFRNTTTPVDILNDNQRHGLHTLFLLDLDDEAMTAGEAIRYLRDHDAIQADDTVVACARLGSATSEIHAGNAAQLQRRDMGSGPHSLIVPGDLHFTEEEALKLWE